MPILRLLACASLVWAVALEPANAQQSALRLNSDYVMIDPQPVTTADRIEVIEFFWYGCPHCYNLEPFLDAWIKRKPADVELRRIPAVFRESWVPHARLYYTLEALGEVERLHQAAYRSIHAENDALETATSTAAWAARHGIDAARWNAAYRSPEVEKKVQQSKDLTRAYKVPGTPSLVVDGRYLTSSGMVESMPTVITNLDGLIAIAREHRK